MLFRNALPYNRILNAVCLEALADVTGCAHANYVGLGRRIGRKKEKREKKQQTNLLREGSRAEQLKKACDNLSAFCLHFSVVCPRGGR